MAGFGEGGSEIKFYYSGLEVYNNTKYKINFDFNAVIIIV